MINTVVVDKPISEIYQIVNSKDYISYIFNSSKIHYSDDDIKILVKYNKKKILSMYENNDFLNFVKNIFMIDDAIISIEQNIIGKKDKFKIRQVMFVEANDNDIIFSTLLSNFKLLVEIDVSEYSQMTNMTLANVQIIENNDFSQQNPQKDLKQIQNTKLKKTTLKHFLKQYGEEKKNFFDSDVQYSDNIIINILNIVIKKAITSEYIRNIYQYFSIKDIDLYSFIS